MLNFQLSVKGFKRKHYVFKNKIKGRFRLTIVLPFTQVTDKSGKVGKKSFRFYILASRIKVVCLF